MSLHNDLLEQASWLAERGEGRPKQASLRRAISAAYYALFHLLVDESSRIIVTGPPELQRLVGRSFQHSNMKKVSQAFSKESLPEHLKSLCRDPLPADLQTVAKTFVNLQEKRHHADYNTNQQFEKKEVLSNIENVKSAFECWDRIRKDEDAKVYLISLLLGRIRG